MQDFHPLSPEERRKRLAAIHARYGANVAEKLHQAPTAWDVIKRVAIGVYEDGFIGLNLGSSAAQSVMLMAVVLTLTVIQFRYIERRVEY